MKYFKRIFLLILLTFSLMLFGVVFFSPYGKGRLYKQRFLKSSIVIKASKKYVYRVLGDSQNAGKWSVFVHHIRSLKTGAAVEGQTGSVRRCYQKENESGLQWDEEVIINEDNRRRRLSIFNMVDFDLHANFLMTDQLYQDVDGGCQLTFTLFFDPGKEIDFLDQIKMYCASYLVQDIFEKNLVNIKHLVENKNTYQRVYPFVTQP